MARRGVLAVLVVVVALIAPAPAYADNSVSATDDGQRLDLSITTENCAASTRVCGATCHATNHRVPTQNAKFILASVICEWRDGSGVWRTLPFDSPSSSSRQNSSTSGTTHDFMNLCGNLGLNGDFPMRARGDGYWIGYNDVRHDFRDAGRLFTTSPYPIARCRG